MALHGSAYLTNDLDIVYERSDENLERLASALKPLRPRLRIGQGGELDFVFDARTLRNGMNFTMVSDAGNVDLLGQIAGFEGYGEIKRASQPVELQDISVPVLTIDGLIRAKTASARPKDRLVLPELHALREAQSGLAP